MWAAGKLRLLAKKGMDVCAPCCLPRALALCEVQETTKPSQTPDLCVFMENSFLGTRPSLGEVQVSLAASAAAAEVAAAWQQASSPA